MNVTVPEGRPDPGPAASLPSGGSAPTAPPAEGESKETSSRNNGASFAAKAVDLPGGDTDTADDVVEITFTAGNADLDPSEVTILIGESPLTWQPALRSFFTARNPGFCAASPGGVEGAWARGTSVYVLPLREMGATCGTGASLGSMEGLHKVQVRVSDATVLDTTIQVHDTLTT